MADIKAIAEELVNLTVKEVNELATVLKDEYGIEPAAAAVAVAAGPAADAAAEAAEAAIAQIAEQYAMPPGASGPDVGTGRPAWEGEISVESEGNVVDSLLCYAITRSSYTGGAHGMYSTQYHIYSLADGFELSLADLFDARQLEILDRAIREKIAETYDAVSDEDLSDRGFFPEYICPTENFRITPEGIAFFYNPYEIGCYALGSVEVTFTWAELDARFAAQ